VLIAVNFLQRVIFDHQAVSTSASIMNSQLKHFDIPHTHW